MVSSFAEAAGTESCERREAGDHLGHTGIPWPEVWSLWGEGLSWSCGVRAPELRKEIQSSFSLSHSLVSAKRPASTPDLKARPHAGGAVVLLGVQVRSSAGVGEPWQRQKGANTTG